MIKRRKISIKLFDYARFALLGMLFSILISSLALAQETIDFRDKNAQIALAHAIDFYDKELSRSTMAYTGRGYYDPHGSIKGHQFFGDDYWEQGKVTYDKNSYDSIYLKYDIHRDLLLIENFNSDGYLSPIILYSPKVSSFDLMGFYFIRLEIDTLSGLKEGYYNLMYESDEAEVLVKRRKEIVNSNEINTLQEMFIQKDRYYIKKDHLYHQVKKKKSILKVLEDHKKELKAFIKSNNYRFTDRPEYQLVEVIKYYSSLP